MSKSVAELTPEQMLYLKQIKSECPYYTHDKLQIELIKAIEIAFRYRNCFKFMCGEEL